MANAQQPYPTVSVSWSNGGNGYVGQSSTFSWNTADANNCSLDGSGVSINSSNAYTYTSPGSYTKTVTCTNERGSVSNAATVSITYQAPSKPGNISAPSTSSNSGTYSLSWNAASGAVTSYQLQERKNGGSWNTVQNTTSRSDSFSKNPDAYYDYRVRACNHSSCSGYTSQKRVTVPAASVSASVSPSLLTYATDSATLTWSSVMTSSCSWSGVSASGKSGSHSQVLSSWSHNNSSNRWESTLSVTCSKIGGGTVSQTLTAQASNREPVPTVTASWNKASMTVGESATLSWTTSGSDACTIDGQSVSVNGSRAYSFGSAQTHNKTVVCSNQGGSQNASASIAVDPAVVTIPAASDPADDLPAGEIYNSYLKGNFKVGASGSASYNVPIAIPPGINGMQPSLSLGYSSDRGHSIAGWGWSISGMSRIHRCAASMLRDGYVSGTHDNEEYKLCLDGQRLVEVASGEYRTERESNRKIVISGSGYQVLLPNGRILSYGLTSDARRPSKDQQGYVDWHLNKVEDQPGNYMTYHYERNGTTGVHRLDHVEYTKNSAGSLNHRVDFIYEERQDVMSGYWSGIPYLHDKRLQVVEVTANGSLVRRYNLAYQGYNDTANADPAKISRLASISECYDLANSVCKAPVSFEWTSRQASAFGFTETKLVDAPHNSFKESWMIDFDGDGVREVLYTDAQNESAVPTKYFVVEQGEAPTYGGDQLKGVFMDAEGNYVRVSGMADINHDGRDDLVYHSPVVDPSGDLDFYVAYSNGVTFDEPEVFLTVDEPYPFTTQFRDFNGDGLVDMYRIPNSGAPIYLHPEPANRFLSIDIALNLGNGQFTDFESRGGIQGGQPDTRRIVDMNGDGLPDVVRCNYIDTSAQEMHQENNLCEFIVSLNEGDDGSGGMRFADQVIWPGADVPSLSWASQRADDDATDPPNERMMFLLDVNGDRITDVVVADKDDVKVIINTGEGFLAPQVWLDQDVTPYYWLGTPVSMADLNADDYPDLVFSADGGGSTAGKNVRVAYNQSGQGFTTPETTNAMWYGHFGEDLNDDGITDIAGLSDLSNLGGPLGLRLGTRFYENNLSRHQITEINTAGPNIAISFEPLNSPAVHTQASGNLALSAATSIDYTQDSFNRYYEVDGTNVVATFSTTAVATRYLVQDVDIDDGLGGTNNTHYHYSGFLQHRGGWGGLGFAEIQITQTLSTGEQTRMVSEYVQQVGGNYNAAGLLATRTQYADDSNGMLQQVSRTQNAWHVQTLADDLDGDTSPHYRVTRDASHSRSQELNGNLVANVSQYSLAYAAAAPTACMTAGVTDFVAASTSRHSGIDAYGNVHQSATVVCDGSDAYSRATKNTYENRDTTSQWLLGLVTNSQSTSIAPDANGTAQSLTREVSYTYTGAWGLLTTVTREPNNSDLRRVTSYSNFDSYGAPQTVTETWNDAEGLSASSRASTVSVNYQSDGSRTVTSTNALGHQAQVVMEGKFGNVLSQTDLNNNLTTYYSYDALGRVDTVTAPDGATVETRYRVCNNCEAPSPYASYYVHTKATGASSTRSYFDAFGREVGQRMLVLTGVPSYTQIDYNAAGRVHKASQPFFLGEERYDTEYTYDSLGRVTDVVAPNDGTTTTQYNGLETTVTNALGQQKVTWTNGLGQSVRVQDDNGTEIAYGYDPFGNLEQTEVAPFDGGNSVTTTMGYDLLGRQLYLDDPSAGRVDYGYNGLDLMVHSTDAKNQRTTFAYDLLGRQITRVDDALASNPATRTHEWFYDTPNSGDGRLDSVVGFDTDGGAYSEQYSYNAYGLPTLVETAIDGQTYSTQTYYDDFNRPAAITYPTGFAVVNHFNNYGYRHQVSNGLSGQTLWTANTSDALGNITDSTHGNNVQTSREYDPATGLVESILAQSSHLVVQNQEYGFDVLGNLAWRSDQRANGGFGILEAFCYDNLNRLSAVRENSCGPADEDIAYDALGNIQTRVMPQGGAQSYSYNSGNPYRLASTNLAGSYGYDANGNITSGDGRSITYSAFDKPIRMTKDGNVVDITYGSDQMRIKRVDNNSTTTVYVAGIYEKIIEGSLTKHLHYVGDIAIHVWEEENSSIDSYTHYLHHDHIGSIVAKSNEAGDAAEFMANDPWGLRREETWLGQVLGTSYTPEDTRRSFTGHEHMDGVGLIHMNGRVYDPNLARFLSADPIVNSPDNTQHYNRYAYVWNNPLKFIDPSGYDGCAKGANASNCMTIWIDPPDVGGGSLEWRDIGGQAHYKDEDGNWAHYETLGGSVMDFGTLANGMEFVSMTASSNLVGSNVAGATASFGNGMQSAPGMGSMYTLPSGLEVVATTASSSARGGRVSLNNAPGVIDSYPLKADVRQHLMSMFGNKDVDQVSLRMALTKLNNTAISVSRAEVAMGVFDATYGDLQADVLKIVGASMATPFILHFGSVAVRFGIAGKEISYGNNFRIALFGNRTGHPTGKFPHYHRRGVDKNGMTEPGQGIKRHRPWDTKQSDGSFWDRF